MASLRKLREIERTAKKYKPTLARVDEYFENVEIIDRFKPVIGEHEIRLTAFISFLFGGNSVMVTGGAGSGKTRITDAITALVFGDEVFADNNPNCFIISTSSAKASIYTPNAINEARFLYAPELQKIAMTSDYAVEMLKDWAEGKPYVYRVTTPKGAKNVLKEDSTMRIVLDPKPVLTTLAIENKFEVGEELGRRYLTLYTRADREQTRKILEAKAKYKVNPNSVKTMTDGEIEILKNHCKSVINMRGTPCINPGMHYITKRIPDLFIISRSYIDYLSNLFDGITLFYYKDRVIYDGYFFTTLRDIAEGWIIYSQQFIMRCLEIEPVLGREILDMLPESIMRKREEYGKSAKEIREELKEQGFQRKLSVVKEILNSLVMTGWLDIVDDLYYKSGLLEELRKVIDWNEINEEIKTIMKKVYPKIADEYIKKHCKDKVYIYYPFDSADGRYKRGERVDILSDEFSGRNKEEKKINDYAIN